MTKQPLQCKPIGGETQDNLGKDGRTNLTCGLRNGPLASHFRVTDGDDDEGDDDNDDLIFKQGYYSEQYFCHFLSFNYLHSSHCLTQPYALLDGSLK